MVYQWQIKPSRRAPKVDEWKVPWRWTRLLERENRASKASKVRIQIGGARKVLQLSVAVSQWLLQLQWNQTTSWHRGVGDSQKLLDPKPLKEMKSNNNFLTYRRKRELLLLLLLASLSLSSSMRLGASTPLRTTTIASLSSLWQKNARIPLATQQKMKNSKMKKTTSIPSFNNNHRIKVRATQLWTSPPKAKRLRQSPKKW